MALFLSAKLYSGASIDVHFRNDTNPASFAIILGECSKLDGR